MSDRLIPVRVYNYIKDEFETWYIDISKLGLSSLIKLKEELLKNSDDLAVRAIDKNIFYESGYNNYFPTEMVYKENKKNRTKSYQYKRFKPHKRK